MISDKTKLKEKILELVDVVADLDEPYKSLTFKALLDKFLESKSDISTVQVNAPKISVVTEQPELPSPEPEQESGSGIDKIIHGRFDWSKYNYIHKLDGNLQDYLVLKIALEEFGVDGLTPPEISKILDEKFRISRIYNSVSMNLAKTRGEYVDRKREGVAYYYRILNSGLELLNKAISSVGQI
ncbi:MAG: hypothetical protein V1836_02250 [Candidatus Aenigmatarchaeota archaeon]